MVWVHGDEGCAEVGVDLVGFVALGEGGGDGVVGYFGEEDEVVDSLLRAERGVRSGRAAGTAGGQPKGQLDSGKVRSMEN